MIKKYYTKLLSKIFILNLNSLVLSLKKDSVHTCLLIIGTFKFNLIKNILLNSGSRYYKFRQ